MNYTPEMLEMYEMLRWGEAIKEFQAMRPAFSKVQLATLLASYDGGDADTIEEQARELRERHHIGEYKPHE